jgi:hypothetical protein
LRGRTGWGGAPPPHLGERREQLLLVGRRWALERSREGPRAGVHRIRPRCRERRPEPWEGATRDKDPPCRREELISPAGAPWERKISPAGLPASPASLRSASDSGALRTASPWRIGCGNGREPARESAGIEVWWRLLGAARRWRWTEQGEGGGGEVRWRICNCFLPAYRWYSFAESRAMVYMWPNHFNGRSFGHGNKRTNLPAIIDDLDTSYPKSNGCKSNHRECLQHDGSSPSLKLRIMITQQSLVNPSSFNFKEVGMRRSLNSFKIMSLKIVRNRGHG